MALWVHGFGKTNMFAKNADVFIIAFFHFPFFRSRQYVNTEFKTFAGEYVSSTEAVETIQKVHHSQNGFI